MTEMPKVRLFVDLPLAAGAPIALRREQAHYLGGVMRQGAGDVVALFNGRDGEWRARIDHIHRGNAALQCVDLVRAQTAEPDLWLLVAPIRKARFELVVEKATELGVAAIHPVVTRRSEVREAKAERLTAIAIEAAEQCERLTVPAIAEAQPLARLLDRWPSGRHLFMCDEARDSPAMAAALAASPSGSAAILIGPEGGFAPEERELLRARPFVTPVSLGPRVLRAETAAIVAVSLWQMLAADRVANP